MMRHPRWWAVFRIIRLANVGTWARVLGYPDSLSVRVRILQTNKWWTYGQEAAFDISAMRPFWWRP